MRNDHSLRDRRSSALLDVADDETRGRLKIFLGAAPGVGKTYKMLMEAQASRRDGIDVVVGVVETHGRPETAALLEGLSTIPRRTVVYKGQHLEEFDIDAARTRKPKLVLIDELAHTNAPGSRHPKRFLDVEELLDEGINVYATLNIQHVEALNDIVAQITRIRVRETVPDRILDRADDIELVDLTPDDLIRRLREGKIYLPKNAERALKHYFSPANLTALRELALRRTAQRVDTQLLQHMQSRAITGPWAAGEHILVCIDEQPGSTGLVRYAKRVADRLHARWSTLHIDDPRSASLSDAERDRLAETMRLAEHLDSETIRLPAMSTRVAEDILLFASENNVTQIVVGRGRQQNVWRRRSRLVRDLVDKAGQTGVTIIGDSPADQTDATSLSVSVSSARTGEPLAFAAAVFAVLAALGFSALARPLIGLESVDLVFLTAVVGIAVAYGLWPSLLTVALSSLCYNFFFLPPLYSFAIAGPTDVVAFLFFTMVAVVVSNLAARARFQTLAAKTRSQTTEALFAFSRKLAACKTIDDVMWTTAFQIASMLAVRVVILLPDANTVKVQAGYPPEDQLDDADLAAALWAYSNNTAAGRGADTLPGAKRLFLPLRTGRAVVGVIGLDDDGSGPLLSPDARRLLDALNDLSALSIERMTLMEELDHSKLAVETDRLRQALLTSISHDLKTPLAAVFGAAGTLRDLRDSLDEESKTELLETIMSESERLNRFIANLLDMTKLESGAIAPNVSLQDITDIVGATLRRATKILSLHKIETALEPNLPPLKIDPILIEQALFNVLDNAAKYGEPGSLIRIEGEMRGHLAHLRIIDQGSGILPDDLERIFDKFYRATKGDSVRAGTGLGLAIARGFIEAMGGSLTAANRADGKGAIFTVSLPVPAARSPLDNAA